MSDNKDKIIKMRVSEDQYNDLKARAKKDKTTISAILSALAFPPSVATNDQASDLTPVLVATKEPSSVPTVATNTVPTEPVPTKIEPSVATKQDKVYTKPTTLERALAQPRAFPKPAIATNQSFKRPACKYLGCPLIPTENGYCLKHQPSQFSEHSIS